MDEDILAYGWNAVDIAVLDGTVELFFNGRPVKVFDAENLLDAPNVVPFQVWAMRKEIVPPLPEVDESRYRCSMDEFWN